ncbi:hypothetical protein GGR51DRAFT_569209 [Nemania sp. FL0031]|nr:hypothetical protein GGR51DRAFT_569209 [Nemania sp. FL0031]
MPPKTTDGELTAKEKAILALAWKCFQNEPKIDLDKLAALGGYTNPRSASNILAVAKKKLAAGLDGADATGAADDEGNVAVASPKTPQAKKAATPRGKKRAIETDADGNGESPTPKRVKKTPAKSTPKKKMPVADEDQDTEEEVKPEIKVDPNVLEGAENGDVGANNAEFEV